MIFSLTNFVIINGFLDIINALSQIFFGLSWYNLVFTDIHIDFLYFVILYGTIRVYEGITGKELYLSTVTYLMEVVYFYTIDTLTSLVCLIIAILLILFR